MDHLEQAVAFYEEDLPNADLVDEEFHLWKFGRLSTPKQERPQTLSDAMKHCCPKSLPNIFTRLKFFALANVRHLLLIKLLNNYLRCTQTEERLSALTLIYCNFSESIDIDEVSKLFVQKYTCKIECANMSIDSPLRTSKVVKKTIHLSVIF